MPASVLIVEGYDLARETIAYMLQALKYHVHPVANIELASDTLRSVSFDILILGLTRDDPDGNELAKVAKAVQRDIKVIVVSGSQPPEHLLPYVDAFVRKPFSLDQISKAIKEVGA